LEELKASLERRYPNIMFPEIPPRVIVIAFLDPVGNFEP
jgi:hypothetical protein